MLSVLIRVDVVVVVFVVVVVVVVLDAQDHVGDQALQLLGAQLARLQHLLVVGFLLALVVHDGLVGDERQGEAAHATVAGYQDLVNRAHSCQNGERERERENATLKTCYSESCSFLSERRERERERERTLH